MSDEAPIQVLDHRQRRWAEQIVAVQRAAYAVEAELLGFEGIPARFETVEDVMASDLTMLAVVEGEEPVAVLGYRRDGEAVDIDRLVVLPDHFRRGLARRLLEHLHAREADAARFDVSTGRDNLPAVTLYQRLGYRKVADVALPEGIVITRFTRER